MTIAWDVDADHADFLARGVDADPEVVRIDDARLSVFFVRDPDGNRLLIGI